MIFTGHYASPLGNILLTADETGLTGLWFEGQKYYAQGLPEERREAETPVLTQTKDWLDIYFFGEKPDFLPPLHPAGSQFRQDVESFAGNPLWGNQDLRRNFEKTGGTAKFAPFLRPGGGRGRGA